MNRRQLIKNTIAITSGTLLGKSAFSQMIPELSINAIPQSFNSKEYFGDGRDWFFKNRFGMFIHWGLYSIPAWHEQYQQRANIPRAEYQKLAEKWNPVHFDPDKWIDLMQEAGMKYITCTVKHHDGFCLWDTKQTDYNTVNTPYNKDILAMLAEACHKRNVPLSLYYSVVDWHHPNYPNEGRHHELPGPEKGDSPDWNLYMKFLTAQVRELCTNYGELHGFWWDMNVPEFKDPSINEMIRELQPKAVINNRGFDDGDFGTPERDYDMKSMNAKTFSRPVEACQSVGMESWGFREDEDYFSDRYLKKSIDSYLSRDANYLLNVGPDSTGRIPEVSANILKRIGVWYKSVKESYENVELANDLISDKDIYLTKRDTVLYVHLNKLPKGNSIKLKPISIKPKSGILLNTGKELDFEVIRKPSEKEPFLTIQNLPANEMSNTVLVLKLEFNTALSALESLPEA